MMMIKWYANTNHGIASLMQLQAQVPKANDALTTVSFVLKKQSRNHGQQEETMALETIRRVEHVESVAKRRTSHRMDHSKGPPSNLPP